MNAAPPLLAAILAIGASFGALAAPHYSGLVMSDQRGGKAKHVFARDTPKIYLRGHVEMPPGTVVKGRWVAVHTKVAPPNYRIDESTLRITPNMDEVTFSMGRPNAGWPAGDYRVELFIDDRHVRDVTFRVK